MIEETDDALLIPSPVLPEVDYLVSERMGPAPMLALLADVERAAYLVEDLTRDDYPRVRELMDRYADQDLGFVDASVLAVVERLGERKVATLDRRHFSVVRPRHVEALELLPE
ncbi:MAG TPA: VapC toxin family PIN domain ribonuclease [Acidimicrobiales bacterium]|nr:VapC toxin family PIN domain ribonuclease [Acidimicrobiales bacterium]